MSIKDRKIDHVDLTVAEDMQYRQGTGFDSYHLVHNALPEVNFDEVTTEATLLGRSFSFPLFISSMTGGYTEAGAVNAILAEFCEEYRLPLGVGSQRIMLEDPDALNSFTVVREKAPTAFIASNIGGAQLRGGLDKDKLNFLIDSIEADAVIVHLNPLQELMQPEGDRNFKGIEQGIQKLAEDSPVPLIVKETGAGISGEVSIRLLKAGCSVIDIAGAGGTSWAKVENKRSSNKEPKDLFNEWGIPTVRCLNEVTALKTDYQFELIASGGVRSSFDIVKALCLGADFTASAQPVIQAVVEEGMDGVKHLIDNWQMEVKIIMALIGCEQLSELDSGQIKLGPNIG